MTKEEFVGAVASEAGTTKAEARRVIDASINVIGDTLAKGIRIQLPGFGGFQTRIRKARKGRNPQTGKEIDIPQRTVAVFKPGKNLREKVDVL